MGSTGHHPLVLNVLLLQPSLRRDSGRGPRDDLSHLRVVDKVEERIRFTPTRRARDIALALGVDEDLRAHASEYRPLIYGTWGTYDVAAIYASPAFVPMPPTPRLANLRQVVTGCTLPRRDGGTSTASS